MPAQFTAACAARRLPGNGNDHSNPSTHHAMTGTQIQCSALFVRLRWLSP